VGAHASDALAHTRPAHLSHARRSRPGGKRSRMARRNVMRAERIRANGAVAARARRQAGHPAPGTRSSAPDGHAHARCAVQRRTLGPLAVRCGRVASGSSTLQRGPVATEACRRLRARDHTSCLQRPSVKCGCQNFRQTKSCQTNKTKMPPPRFRSRPAQARRLRFCWLLGYDAKRRHG
jgi:hypothetical protein